MKPATRFVEYGVKTFVLTAMLCFPWSLAAQSKLDGVWQTGEDNSQVEISEKDGVATGKLVSSDNSRAKTGTEILRNFSLVNGVWKGNIYTVKRDKLYKASITPSADTLKITVSAGMMTQKLSWTRVSPSTATKL